MHAWAWKKSASGAAICHLFAGGPPPRGVERAYRACGQTVLETISFALATVWSYRHVP